MCAPARGELTCSRTGVTRRRTPSAALWRHRSRWPRSRSRPSPRSAQEAPTWSQFQGGPGHSGVLVDGPQPPYRVDGDCRPPRARRSRAPSSRATWRSRSAREAVVWDRRRLGHRRVAGGAGRRPAVGPGDRGRSRGRRSSSTSRDRVRTTPAGRPTARRARPRAARRAGRHRAPPPPRPRPGRSSRAAVRRWSRSPWPTRARSGERPWRRSRAAGSRSTVERVRRRRGRDGVRRLAGDRRDLLVRGDGRAASTRPSPSPTDGWSRSPGTPTRRRSSWRRSTRRRGSVRGRARDPGELHGGDRGVGGRWFAVHRFGGPARPSARRRGRDRSMGDAGALAVLAASALAFDDQSVFAADIAGGLYRLDAADGGRAWGYQSNEVVSGARRSSPATRSCWGWATVVWSRSTWASGHLVWQSAPSPGLVGTIALASDAVIAVKGGRDAGLIAFEHDPEGTLDRRPLADRARGRDHADALGARGGHRLRRRVRPGAVGASGASVWPPRARLARTARTCPTRTPRPRRDREREEAKAPATGLGQHRSRPNRPKPNRSRPSPRSSPPRRPNHGDRSAAPCSVRPVGP